MSTTEQLNTALDGRYVIERLIGQGGMATVYLARDLRHNRRVALKVLKPDLNAVLGNDRFLAEIQVTANLQHPNLLPLFDSGVVDQLLFYVMPFVEGESLRARLEREKQLSVDEVVRLTTSMANALDYAHRQGVIHRDLKPENVLLQEGQPLIADFGIALAVSNAGGGRITQTGLSLGTPQYMSPEQATGERAIDARTDQYSLGALAYEMLTGEPPHVGATSQAIIARLLTETPRPIRAVRASVPLHVEAAVTRALEKLPADRWNTTREFAEALTNTSMTAASTRVLLSGSEHAPSRSAAARTRELAAWGVALSGLAAAGYFATQSPQSAARTAPIVFDLELPPGLLFSNLGGAGSVAVDREGTMLAFQARDSSSTAAIYLRRLDQSSVVRVAGTENSGAPNFSPDGREIRFFSAGSIDTSLTQAYTVPISGGAKKLWLTTPSNFGLWSEQVGGPIVVASRAGFGTVPPEGGTMLILLRPDSVYRRFAFPEALPGGSAALVGLFVGGRALDSSYLAHVSLKDGTVQRLSIKGVKPRYSPTGHLVWSTAGGELWAATWNPSRPLENGPQFRIAEGVFVGPGGGTSYSISDNGVLVYAEGTSAFTGGLRRVVAVNRDGVERPLTVPVAFMQHPRLSPDGKILLVSRGTSPEARLPTPDIWRIDLARGSPSRVTLDSVSMRPYWFPDGERLAYVRRYDSDSSTGHIRRADGTGVPIRIGTRDVFVRGVTVSTRGDYLALSVGGTDASGGDDVWLVHMDSLNSPRPFLSESYQESAPRFSPDGRWLAFESRRDGRPEIYVRALSGGAETKISVDGGQEPVWSRKGDELFFRGERYLMAAQLSFAGGPTVTDVRQLFDAIEYVSSNYGQYDVTPDGKEFLFVREAGERASRPTDRVRIIVDWPLLAKSSAP